MRTFEQYIAESYSFRLGGSQQKGFRKYNYSPKDNDELNKVLKQLYEERGDDGDYNDIDTSEIENFNSIFNKYKFIHFNGDVSKWDVSKGKSFCDMFRECFRFERELNLWDVSEGEDFSGMFHNAYSLLNQDFGEWDVSNALYMTSMFKGGYNFRGRGLDKWKLKKIKSVQEMFFGCKYLKVDLSSWTLSNSVLHTDMFKGCTALKKEYKPKFV